MKRLFIIFLLSISLIYNIFYFSIQKQAVIRSKTFLVEKKFNTTININEKSFYILNSQFIKCKSTDSFGGAIFAHVPLTIVKCFFNDCFAQFAGHVYNSDSTLFSFTTFINTKASRYGFFNIENLAQDGNISCENVLMAHSYTNTHGDFIAQANFGTFTYCNMTNSFSDSHSLGEFGSGRVYIHHCLIFHHSSNYLPCGFGVWNCPFLGVYQVIFYNGTSLNNYGYHFSLSISIPCFLTESIIQKCLFSHMGPYPCIEALEVKQVTIIDCIFEKNQKDSIKANFSLITIENVQYKTNNFDYINFIGSGNQKIGYQEKITININLIDKNIQNFENDIEERRNIQFNEKDIHVIFYVFIGSIFIILLEFPLFLLHCKKQERLLE